jgi:hypothetical protein
MKKKIGDLTYQEAVNLCEKYSHKCKNCPLSFVVSEEEEWVDCRVDLVASEIKPILTREIEVDK